MQMKKYEVIGKRLPRVDAWEHATGKSIFAADIYMPDMLYGRALRSPHAHARIIRIDASKALALEGVKAVITGKDFPDIPQKTYAAHGEGNIDMWSLSRIVIARDKALYHGQAVAAVAAVTPQIAEQALKLIEVEYEVLPPVMDIVKAIKPDAPVLHPELFTQEVLGEKAATPSNIALKVQYALGDVQAGFKEADVVIENTYRTSTVQQAYLEPDAAVAKVESDKSVTIWTSTQTTFSLREQLAVLLGMSPRQIRVIPTEIGGGFGGKIRTRIQGLCIKLAQKAGRPVKMVFSREEVFRATGTGAGALVTTKLGARKDGRLTALNTTVYYDSGAFPGAMVSWGMVMGTGPYRVPNVNIEGYDVVTNKPRAEAMRAPCVPPLAFALESQMDIMAERLGMAPLEFRVKNAAEEGDKLPNGWVLSNIGFKEVLERVANHPLWKASLKGGNRGRGLACALLPGGTGTSSCQVTVNSDGTLELSLGTVDLTGTRTTMTQIAAEEFDISPEEVRATVADSATIGHTDVSAGSRVTFTMSNAVHMACQDALAQLKQKAAAVLKANVEDIEYAKKRFWIKGSPERSVMLAELALASIKGAGPIIGKGSVTRMSRAPQCSAHIADVEVDPETGKAKILDYTIITDVGKAVNPIQVESQLQGAASMGIGIALFEGYEFGNGVLQNATYQDYRIPTAADLPMINTEIVEVPSRENPFGIRGMGENAIVPPTGAIANAIYRAAGVRLRRLPMTQERVLWAIHTLEEKPVPLTYDPLA